MVFHASGITSITFLSYRILDRKGLGHAGPLRSATTPVNPPPRGPLPYRWHPFLFRPFYLVALVYCLFPRLFTAWLMILAVPCHCLSFRFHDTIRAWLVQIRCALNLNIGVEWQLLYSNTSPGLPLTLVQCSICSRTI